MFKKVPIEGKRGAYVIKGGKGTGKEVQSFTSITQTLCKPTSIHFILGGYMQLSTVESSMVQAIGYDPETRTLEVIFNNDTKYQYHDVPQEQYQELMNAESKGRYMHAHIIDKYACTRIEDTES